MLEILAPAGNAECALAAINNGADAIYLGYSSFSARQSAGNFDQEGLRSIIEKAHFNSVRVYVAMNTIVKDSETENFLRTLLTVWGMGADAIILQDLLLGQYVHELYPEIILHASTQAGICSLEGAKYAKSCGFSRVILARETPLSEIKKITAFTETEVFVQGALCTAYSGQCFFSSFAGGNSGNRGRCKQPCRKLYAYDRNNNTEKNYALSLSDLSIGEDIEKLIDAGVCSFKIEGRMRRAEYVAAAVRYYRILIDKKQGEQKALSDLKRTYNRGNYTKGLAFGQDKRFLSPVVQGHLGEKVGVVKVFNTKFYVESLFKPRQGDAFKILRDGKEIGGAAYVKTEGKAFIISSKVRLKNGDSVFVTTDTEVNERLLNIEKTTTLPIKLYFVEGEHAKATYKNICVFSNELLQSANNRPLTKQEIRDCFSKTDDLPIKPSFAEIILQGNIFIPKSQLNAFRRKFYQAVSEEITKNGHKQYEYISYHKAEQMGKNAKTAVIASDFSGISPDIAIYKPDDFRATLPDNFSNGKFEKYLYYPAFTTEKDLEILQRWSEETAIDGIYAENYGGIIFAQQHKLKLFAGVGLHLINQISLFQLLRLPNLSYYCISKEANEEDARLLIGKNAFYLSSGNLKIMDLCYCPFGKTCSVCDKKKIYMLTDESGREFPVRRYFSADGNCRFEVYNCATLIGRGIKDTGQLFDFTLIEEKEIAFAAKSDETEQKSIYGTYTSGHIKRGVL